MSWTPTPEDTPFHRLGGEEGVRAVSARFYDLMDAEEPELSRLHECDAERRVSAGARERFATFLVEWMGGPARYSPEHGHPRLRMRHADVPVTSAMQAAWLRCMAKALLEHGATEEVRSFLAERFAQISENLRNVKD